MYQKFQETHGIASCLHTSMSAFSVHCTLLSSNVHRQGQGHRSLKPDTAPVLMCTNAEPENGALLQDRPERIMLNAPLIDLEELRAFR